MREVARLESRIEHVTVYARGARVRRVASVPAPLPRAVRFVGLPLALLDHSVRVDVAGPALVTMVRTGVDVPGGATRPEESGELRVARMRLATAQSEVERIEAALDRLSTASIVEHDPSDETPAPWSAVITARRALVALRAERELTLRQALARAREELDAARRAFAVAAERDQRSGSARVARLHETRKYVELDIVAEGSGGDVVVHVEYQVAAARWAPSYVARLGDSATQVELRAVVAQQSGEDWTGVALVLSTAEADNFTQLPELHPQKIGRRQAEPARRGFRSPPAGAGALYADYDAGFPRRSSLPSPTSTTIAADLEGELAGDFADQVWDEETSRAKDLKTLAPPPPPAAARPMSLADMPMQPAARGGKMGSAIGAVAGLVAAPFAMAAQSRSRQDAASNAPGGGGGAARERRAEPGAPTPRLDYGSLRMAPPTSHERGTLVAMPPAIADALVAAVDEASAEVQRLPLPPGHVADWIHTYDYAFASDGMVDVNADGVWHSIALTSRAGSATVRHVAVPREQPDVFRVAAIANPFDGPLLPGPIDVYDRGQFLVTSDIEYTPPGATVDVGLGVDPQIKIARNAEFREEAAGMLKGKLDLHHKISIDVENLSGRPITLEVRERVPVAREDDDEVTVAIGKVEPAWESWTPDPDGPRDERLRGGQRWVVELAARAKRTLRAAYDVKIASKHELVGGNRREP